MPVCKLLRSEVESFRSVVPTVLFDLLTLAVFNGELPSVARTTMGRADGGLQIGKRGIGRVWRQKICSKATFVCVSAEGEHREIVYAQCFCVSQDAAVTFAGASQEETLSLVKNCNNVSLRITRNVTPYLHPKADDDMVVVRV